MSKHQLRSIYVIAVLVVIAFATYMFWPRAPLFPPDYVPAILGVNAGNYPSVNGSRTTTALGDMLLARALRLPGSLQRVTTPPSLQVTFPPNKEIETVQTYLGVRARTAHAGTHDAYLSLINGPERMASAAKQLPTSLILVTREPNDTELAAAKAREIELSVCLIAYDALVFIVNEKNPVQGLTLAQARAIFTGGTTDWAALGGTAGKIVPLLPAYGDTRELIDRDLFEGKVPGLLLTEQPLTAATLIAQVAKNPRAIACVTYHDATVVAPSAQIRLLNLDNVTPDGRHLRKLSAHLDKGDYTPSADDYALVEGVYGVVRSDSTKDDPAFILLQWLRAHYGQRLVAECGYVPL